MRMNVKTRKITIVAVTTVVVIAVALGIGAYVYQQNKVKAAEKLVELKKERKENEAYAKKAYENMFSDAEQKVIKLEISKKEITSFKAAADKVIDKKLKKQYVNRIVSIEKFMKVRDTARSYLLDNVLKLDITDEKIADLQAKFGALEEGFQPVIKEVIDNILSLTASI